MSKSTHTHTHTGNLKSSCVFLPSLRKPHGRAGAPSHAASGKPKIKPLNRAASQTRRRPSERPLTAATLFTPAWRNSPLRRSCGARCGGRWWQFFVPAEVREVAACGWWWWWWWGCRVETSRFISSVAAAWWAFKSHAARLHLEVPPHPLKKWKLADGAFPPLDEPQSAWGTTENTQEEEEEEEGGGWGEMRAQDAKEGGGGRLIVRTVSLKGGKK